MSWIFSFLLACYVLVRITLRVRGQLRWLGIRDTLPTPPPTIEFAPEHLVARSAGQARGLAKLFVDSRALRISLTEARRTHDRPVTDPDAPLGGVRDARYRRTLMQSWSEINRWLRGIRDLDDQAAISLADLHLGSGPIQQLRDALESRYRSVARARALDPFELEDLRGVQRTFELIDDELAAIERGLERLSDESLSRSRSWFAAKFARHSPTRPRRSDSPRWPWCGWRCCCWCCGDQRRDPRREHHRRVLGAGLCDRRVVLRVVARFSLDAGQWVLVAMVSVWALRLGVYLGRRNLGHGEDRRYVALRERIGARFWWVSLVMVFGLQGVMLWVVSLPIQAALLAGGGPWVGVVAIGSLALWFTGLAFESVGDRQLARFKAIQRTKGASWIAACGRGLAIPTTLGTSRCGGALRVCDGARRAVVDDHRADRDVDLADEDLGRADARAIATREAAGLRSVCAAHERVLSVAAASALASRFRA